MHLQEHQNLESSKGKNPALSLEMDFFFLSVALISSSPTILHIL